MYIQYSIVFVMQLVILLLLIAVSCILIQSVYDMTDTALGNAGLNAKSIPKFNLHRIKDILSSIGTGFRIQK